MLVLFTISYFLLLIMPFYFLFHYWLIRPDQTGLILVSLQVFLILLFRLILAVRYRGTWHSVILHPLSIGLMLLIGVRSGVLNLRHEGYSWKGRRYN